MISKPVLQWLSLAAVIWLQSTSGTNTNFPAYSSQLKTMLNMSQVQINSLAFASDAGKLFGWFSGIAAIYLPLWLVLLIGGSLGLVGYGIQYLFLTHHIASLSYWQIFVLTVLAGNSICWINTVSYVVTISNFPSSRQVAVGITSSYQGLSASIYTTIVDAIMLKSSPTDRAKAYLLLSSTLPIVVSLVTAPIARCVNMADLPDARKGHEKGFVVLFIVTIATGIYAVVISLASVSNTTQSMHNALGMGLLLIAPIVVPLAKGIKKSSLMKSWKKVHNLPIVEGDAVDGNSKVMKNGVDLGNGQIQVITTSEEVVVGNIVPMPHECACNDEVVEDVNVREEVGVKEMLREVDFWLYFLVYLCGATLGLVFLNNLGQIAESRGSSKTSSLVALSSAFGFFGRLLPSFQDHLFSRKNYTISRPLSIAVLMAPMTGALFLLVTPYNKNLWLPICTAIIGVCTGAISSIAVATTAELFGTKNFSVNHNVLVANIPIGSFAFGYLAACIYRQEAGSNNGDGTCMGMECYRKTFIIWGSLCLLGTFLAITLYVRTRKFYQRRLGTK